MHLLYGFTRGEEETSNKVANILLFGMCFDNLCTRSETFKLPLRGIMNIYEYSSFSPEIISSSGRFSRETCAVFLYSDSVAYFEINNQNHHRQKSYNYNTLFRIIDNLLERNTTRLTWKLPQYGD